MKIRNITFVVIIINIIFLVTTYVQAQSTFYGTDAGINTTGIDNSFFGWKAGEYNIGGIGNTFTGRTAGYLNVEGKYNSFYGSEAGKKNKRSSNSFFGFQSGFENTTGYGNTFIGAKSGHKTTIGFKNTFIGKDAGNENIAGYNNVYIGESAGKNRASGFENVMLGSYAGAINPGNRSIHIGYNSNFLLGPQKNNVLFIDTKVTNTPLIYGEFDNDLIRINGEFEAMGGVSNNSDVNSKQRIAPINTSNILSKIANMSITEWEYINVDGVKHIGPMAQDFYAAFGLGAKETAISTVDAIGVLMAAIKGMNEKLERETEVLRAEIRAIKSQNDLLSRKE